MPTQSGISQRYTAPMEGVECQGRTNKVYCDIGKGKSEEHLEADHPYAIIRKSFFGLLPFEVACAQRKLQHNFPGRLIRQSQLRDSLFLIPI